ncbi:hypothetical protein H6P81_011827 [Aristolochia fimbriata]|uniref:Uncharacterized protein n=1 Tax=Aristolochia fimbriata TaxID=158543 RepID=A0AAV7EAG7_ARIFI|nr:hypothetical protein H6P81_011827 [Aristolochia fimbriata]
MKKQGTTSTCFRPVKSGESPSSAIPICSRSSSFSSRFYHPTGRYRLNVLPAPNFPSRSSSPIWDSHLAGDDDDGGLGVGEDDGANVENAVEAAGGAADLQRGERGDAAAGEEVGAADEEPDCADEGVPEVPEGVDLDGDGGGVGGEEVRGDPEDELVVPGGVFEPDAIDARSELGGGVDQGNGVGVGFVVRFCAEIKLISRSR